MQSIRNDRAGKRLFPLPSGLPVFFIAVFAWFWLSGVQEARAQPAVFSSETEILEIPAIEINGLRKLEEVELQLIDGNALEFRIVDYGANRSDRSIQKLALKYGEIIDLDTTRTLQFIDVMAESRCPLNVLCITSGEVTVILRIVETLSDGNRSRTDFGLTLNGLAISEHHIDGIWYRLAVANPYPDTSEEVVAEDYDIVLEMSHLPFK